MQFCKERSRIVFNPSKTVKTILDSKPAPHELVQDSTVSYFACKEDVYIKVYSSKKLPV